jgi:hypothetical protein
MHVFEQGLRFEGLEQKVASAGPHGFDGAVDVGESGHQNDRQLRKAAADFLEQGNAIDRQHAHVADDQRHGVSGSSCSASSPPPRRRGLPCQFEGIAYRLTQCGVVFHHQNRQSLCHRCHLSSVFSPCRRFDG